MSVSGVPPRDSGVVEVARFDVKHGCEEEFAAAYRTVRHVLVTTPGCRSARMTRGIESPSSFVLLVEWDSLEAHTQTFRESDRFVRWRAALSPYFATPPAVEHVVALTDTEEATAATGPVEPGGVGGPDDTARTGDTAGGSTPVGSAGQSAG